MGKGWFAPGEGIIINFAVDNRFKVW